LLAISGLKHSAAYEGSRRRLRPFRKRAGLSLQGFHRRQIGDRNVAVIRLEMPLIYTHFLQFDAVCRYFRFGHHSIVLP
jgi:hypothetical protein